MAKRYKQLWLLLAIYQPALFAQLETTIQPKNDAFIVAALPANAISAFDKKPTLHTDANSAESQARQWLSLGEQYADPRYNAYAELSLQHWSHDPNPPIGIAVQRARILERKHNFSGAEKELDRILARAPGNATARLQRSALLRLSGRLHDAEQDCLALHDALQTERAICRADTLSLTEKTNTAGLLLARIFAQLPQRSDSKIWAGTVLAEIAWRSGQPQTALDFIDSLGIPSRDLPIYQKTLRSDLLLSLQRWETIIGDIPDNAPNTLLLRKAIAMQKTRNKGFMKLRKQLDHWFRNESARGDRIHTAEEARYLLDLKNDTSTALQLATINWKNQKSPDDLLLLARAAIAEGDSQSLALVRKHIEETGLQDLRIEAIL